MKPVHCQRVLALPVIACAEIGDGSYKTSSTQVWTAGTGTLTRTGLCSMCDAAIYSNSYGSNEPRPRYHATMQGLVKLLP